MKLNYRLKIDKIFYEPQVEDFTKVIAKVSYKVEIWTGDSTYEELRDELNSYKNTPIQYEQPFTYVMWVDSFEFSTNSPEFIPFEDIDETILVEWALQKRGVSSLEEIDLVQEGLQRAKLLQSEPSFGVIQSSLEV